MAYYCLHQLQITPRQFIEMDDYEKAFVVAAIQIKLENNKKNAKKLKK